MTDATPSDEMAKDPIEIVHSSGRIETIRWGDLELTAKLSSDHGDRIDLRATNGDGHTIWREVFPATSSAIKKAADTLDATPHAPKGSWSAVEAVAPMVWRMIDGAASLEGFVNLFDEPDDQVEGDLYMVWPFVLNGMISALFGETGSTKSANAVAAALATASGKQIGLHRPTGPRRRVGILDGEGTHRDLRAIALAIGKAHGLDMEQLHKDGWIHYVKISQPIIDQVERYRRLVEENDIGFLVIDSVDTARGEDATNRSGVFFDALRHIGVTVLVIDHVTVNQMGTPLADQRPFGAVRTVNRVRQAWAMKAESKGSQAIVQARQNFTNFGPTGKLLGFTMDYVVDEYKRPVSILISDASAVNLRKATKQERCLIAMCQIEDDGDQVDTAQVMELTGFTNSEVSKGFSGMRESKKAWMTPKAQRPKATLLGRNHLDETWGDDWPKPDEG